MSRPAGPVVSPRGDGFTAVAAPSPSPVVGPVSLMCDPTNRRPSPLGDRPCRIRAWRVRSSGRQRPTHDIVASRPRDRPRHQTPSRGTRSPLSTTTRPRKVSREGRSSGDDGGHDESGRVYVPLPVRCRPSRSPSTRRNNLSHEAAFRATPRSMRTSIIRGSGRLVNSSRTAKTPPSGSPVYWQSSFVPP